MKSNLRFQGDVPVLSVREHKLCQRQPTLEYVARFVHMYMYRVRLLN